MYFRKLNLKNPKKTFFLWGPRQSGKTSLLKQQFPLERSINLLKSDEALRYLENPSLLREELSTLSPGTLIIIDEIQKVPSLLNEVHWLIEEKGLIFGLCGSSARALKRGHANLLGGRAKRFEMHGLIFQELQKDFDLLNILNRGTLPAIYNDDDYRSSLRSYVTDYIKEEVMAEGLTRNLPAFSSFLSVAGLADTEVVDYSNIARDVGVSSATVKSYYEVLEDTLLGRFLPAYRLRPKRRTQKSPKFYFFDVGVVNNLAKRGEIVMGSELFGKAFENYIFHELCAYRSYYQQDLDLSYWCLSSQIEVDFIINHMEVAIEVKGTAKVKVDHLKGLQEIIKDYPEIKKRILVSCDSKSRILENGIQLLFYKDFLQKLINGEIV
jgi:predicted AAA+ superfamily ATPase